MTEVIVLDVGHGNSAIVKGPDVNVVIDAPLGPLIVEALREEQIEEVVAALASHSDADHLGGMISLLLAPDIVVREVRCNPDSVRRSQFWGDFKFAVRHAKNTHGTRLRTELTAETSVDLVYGDLAIDVLSPPSDLAVDGVGGRTAEGRAIVANAMSAVLCVRWAGEPLVVFAADLDRAGLDRLIEDDTDLRARVLVFPHHGGIPGGRPSDDVLRDFARQLTERVQPETIVFSFARMRFHNPQPAIVEGVRQAAPEAHIACTQLSRRCSDELLNSDAHLAARFAAGRPRGSCCAGTLVVRPGAATAPERTAHEAAIVALGNRLCG